MEAWWSYCLLVIITTQKCKEFTRATVFTWCVCLLQASVSKEEDFTLPNIFILLVIWRSGTIYTLPRRFYNTVFLGENNP